MKNENKSLPFSDNELLIIGTPYGETYKVNNKGWIAKRDFDFSGGWLFVGLEYVKSGKIEYRFENLTKENLSSINLRFKNGNPRYTVQDIDHGTTRTWGNTQFHGVKWLSIEKTKESITI